MLPSIVWDYSPHEVIRVSVEQRSTYIFSHRVTFIVMCTDPA